MENWRPEKGCKNLFNQAAIKVKDRNGKPISHYEAFEAGFDACLEALKKEGKYIRLHRYLKLSGYKQPIRAPGWKVFIPEIVGGKNAVNLV